MSLRGGTRRLQRVGTVECLLVDSITEIGDTDAGRAIVTGSHGGASAANYATRVRAALYVFNDAGFGKDGAGVAGLDILERAGIAAAAVDHRTARIGDAADTLQSGVVSVANRQARQCGIEVGTTVTEAVSRSRVDRA